MKKRNVVAIIVLIVAICLVIAGVILSYQSYNNQNRIITSFNDLEAALKDVFALKNTNSSTSVKSTVTGRSQITINPLLASSTDGSDVIINNINNSVMDYNYIVDMEAKKMYFAGSMLLNSQSILGVEYYQNESVGYIFLRNIFDKYIVIDDIDIFSYLENSNNSLDDINYVYDKIIESLKANIKKDDIKVATETVDGKETKKISIVLDKERFKELDEAIENDLKDDEKIKEILNASSFITEDSDEESSEELASDLSLTYSIYLTGNNIIKYSLEVEDADSDVTLNFIDDTNKSISLESDGEEVFRGNITNNNNVITIDLLSNEENIGSITISENNMAFNLNYPMDDTNSTFLVFSFDSTRTGNNIVTNADLSVMASGSSISMFKLADNATIEENTANFANINPTNNISIDSLTETDIATIQNNFMTLLYNYLGYSI